MRDYGLPPVEWPAVSYAPMAGLAEIEVLGCEEGCRHEWGKKVPITGGAGNSPDKPSGFQQKGNAGQPGALAQMSKAESLHGQFCQLCGGWRGSLGLEPTIEMFVGHLMLVWRELWRVLRDDGTCWLNLGDSYNNRSISRPSSHQTGLGFESEHLNTSWADLSKQGQTKPSLKNGLKEKDLCGIPWRIAFALQADGWYLRSDIIWAKGVSFCPTYSGSCMPESVRDRPIKGHEYVFLLSKNKRYYYDAEAVRESSTYNPNWNEPNVTLIKVSGDGQGARGIGWHGIAPTGTGRNLRSVWLINPGSYAGAHFATFPPALVTPMILAGTSAKGCCPSCGAAWERVTSKEFIPQQDVSLEKGIKGSGNQKPMDKSNSWEGFPQGTTAVTTTGWRPTCACSTYPQDASYGGPNDVGELEGIPFEPIPCTVLDPFIGSGTTLEVAIKLRRRGVGIELSKEYCDDHIIPRLEKPLQMELAL